ncbi:MAG: hypothetical protein AAFY88_24125 [Acidobacteriota bacterium]
MPALSEYANVHNTAAVILKKKGYQVWFDERLELYCGEKDGWDFMAESPCSLLGLVAIFEAQQPKDYEEYWWRIEEPQVLNDLPSEPEPFEPVWKRR